MARGDTIKIIAGVGMIAFALLPTPDDATIVSPVALSGIGLSLIANALTND